MSFFERSTFNEASKAQKDMERWIKKLIRETTQNCVRRRTVTVVRAPDGDTIGVQEPFDPTGLDLPYLSVMGAAQVGDTVTMEWCYGLSNAMVISYGNGKSDKQEHK